ncbi:MAG TPA: hypothetical protein VFA21_16060 [Pyrinomonadaceae bacterium]|jgi:hypothetical protein|nr:hypothetical protein [Pyrinomonadaceae bacterium]
MTDSDEILTRYLFGELSEPEQARLEARYFEDARAFERLTRLEAEIVDGYARGRLSPQMRERFERTYLADPNRRAHLRFGEALAAKLDQIAASRVADGAEESGASWWQRFISSLAGGRRALAFSLALAVLLLSMFSAWLFMRGERFRRELSGARDAQAADEQREREARQQLAGEQAREQELTAELESARGETKPQPTPAPPAPPPKVFAPPAVAALVLLASGVRGVETGAPPTLIIRKDTQQVRLQLRLRENEYQNYQLVLRSVGGGEVFSRGSLKPTHGTSGASFVLTLPASKLAAGDYILALKGATPGGELEDVSQSLFRVERK